MHGEVLQDMIYLHSSLYLFCSQKLLIFFHQTCLPSCISWLEAGEKASRAIQDFSGATCCFCLPQIVTKWGVIQVLEIIDGVLDVIATTLPMTDRLEYSWFHRCVWKDSWSLVHRRWLNCVVYIPIARFLLSYCCSPIDWRFRCELTKRWYSHANICMASKLGAGKDFTKRFVKSLSGLTRPCKEKYHSHSHLLEMSLDCFRLIAVQFVFKSKL